MARTSRIRVKRVYDAPSPDDGVRLLVDRLWPRGLTKERLVLDRWLKELAPSDDLRRWFNHDPEKWDAFRARYAAELDRKRDAWQPVLDAARDSVVTLLYAARMAGHNNAAALQEYLAGKLVN